MQCTFSSSLPTHFLVKSCVNQLSFPYYIAKELEGEAADDPDRKKGVSKVKFYLVDAKSADELPVPFLSATAFAYHIFIQIYINNLQKYEPIHVFTEKNDVPRRPSQAPRKASDSALPKRLSGDAAPRRASDGTPRKSGSRKYSGEENRKSKEVNPRASGNSFTLFVYFS